MIMITGDHALLVIVIAFAPPLPKAIMITRGHTPLVIVIAFTPRPGLVS